MANKRSLIREEELRSSKVTGGAVIGTESVVEQDEDGNVNLKDKNMGSVETLEDMLKGNYQPIKTLTTSLAGTGLLLVTDAEKVVVTGSALGYTVKLPDATTAPQVGKKHKIYNASSAPIHVVSFSSTNVVTTLDPGQVLHVTLIVNSADGTWVVARYSIAETLTKGPTGFVDPEDVIVTYDDTSRIITLTGTVEAYYEGSRIIELVPGWSSAAHGAAPVTMLHLYYNGSAFVWSATQWLFNYLQIAYVYYDSSRTFQFALRETHGMEPWETHREFHNAIGTYRDSGGDIGDIVLSSTTAADRRPTISETKIEDEDLESTIAAHTTGNNYTQSYLDGAGGEVIFTPAQDDIVDVSGITPQWNEYTGGVWQKTSLGNKDFMSLWLVALPASADATSQAKRFVWMAGQSESITLTAQQALSPTSLNLDGLDALSPEFVIIEQVIIQEVGAGDWEIIEVRKLTGTKASTTSTATGGFLSAVSTDESLDGIGTAGDPLTSRIAATDVATGTYTVLSTDVALNVAVGAVCAITIPTAEIAKNGRMLRITNTGDDAMINNITIVGEGGELINGSASFVINGNGDSIDIEMKSTYAWVI